MERIRRNEYMRKYRQRDRGKETKKKVINQRLKESNFRKMCKQLEINEKVRKHHESKARDRVCYEAPPKGIEKPCKKSNTEESQNEYHKDIDVTTQSKSNNKKQLKCLPRKSEYQNILENKFNKELEEVNNLGSIIKQDSMEDIDSVASKDQIKKEKSSAEKYSYSLKNLSESQTVKKSEPLKLSYITDDKNDASESIEKTYVEFLAKRLYLGKGYRRQQILDYLKQDIPETVKIKQEFFEHTEEKVQIFENESNINLALFERIDILQRFSNTDLKNEPKHLCKSKKRKPSCVKTLAKNFNCNVEDVRKTLRRHISYVKEWEDVILYSPHSSFSIEDLDTILYFWTYECTVKNYPITKNSIKHTAHPIAKLLDLEMFKASDCWLDYFVHKYDVQLRNESPKILEEAAEAVRTVKLSNVITKHLKSLSKSIQEKFTTRRATKPHTYSKKLLKNSSELLETMYSKIRKNSMDLKMSPTKSKNHEKNVHNNEKDAKMHENLDNNNLILNNIKQEPVFDEDKKVDNLRNHNLQNSTDKTDTTEIATIKNSINNLNLEQNIDFINIKKRKIENYNPIGKHIVPNISIESYEHALKYLKPLEEFVMLKSNFRAINYLNCLQNVLKELNKT